ncbi:hypothetical protein A2Y85_02765 [candidate division WOR-3 bacterium RBG_13_43_14]|uniref:Nitroreductase domain-containing protein n=1 Tax=candidate division WOR-3 bacterium RBG_13_43_14 TaxID=1802590 RepID=A0A1F4U2W2_UNCW3|nr:MAG: hypothetical protein A2Y85_02765 [candidate division WOR-3 bacterium RBG_13_43_14]
MKYLAIYLIMAIITMSGADNMVIKLPEANFTNRSIEECIAQRRSVRSYKKNTGLSEDQLSLLLWSAQGITDQARGFRAAPSAGATYPLELFIAKKDGLYRYIPESHSLKIEKKKDLRKSIAGAALNQMFIADASIVIVITAVFERTTNRYGERGAQYINNEVGHCAQNLHLEAVALGLGSVPIGAFDEDKVKQTLELNEEFPLYIVPVGYENKQ